MGGDGHVRAPGTDPVAFFFPFKYMSHGTSLVAQWLRLCVSNTRGVGSIPGRGTKILYVTLHSQKKKKKDASHRAAHFTCATSNSIK